MPEETLWRLREAGAEDCGALALIGAASFLDAFAGELEGAAIIAHCAEKHSPGAYRQYFEAGCHAWLAESANGGAPIGFALTGPPDLAAAGQGDLELKRIYTLSRFFGTGLGKDLMECAVDAGAGCERVILGVYTKNTRALRFYEKHGFAIIGTRQFQVGGNVYDDKVLARPIISSTQAKA